MKNTKAIYCQLKVVITKSMPTVVPNLGCGEGRNFMLANSSIVKQLSGGQPGCATARLGTAWLWNSSGETAPLHSAPTRALCQGLNSGWGSAKHGTQSALHEGRGEADLYREFLPLVSDWFILMAGSLLHHTLSSPQVLDHVSSVPLLPALITRRHHPWAQSWELSKAQTNPNPRI